MEHDGFRLLIDLGYATVPKLLEQMNADEVDAVFISHGHPDHCADLNPLLRARALRDDPPAPLPLYALPGALDAVLALDRPGMLEAAYVLHEISAGSRLDIGRFAPRLACCRTRCQMLGYGWLREVGCSRTPVTPARAQT